jgi:phosphotriesterase-related protein
MNTIDTVTGPVAGDALGMTLIHEHFLFGHPGWYGDMTMAPFDRGACIRAGLAMAAQVQGRGVRTIVDPTPNETGRDPEVLKEIAERCGLNIICATGYYYERESAPAYFKFRKSLGGGQSEIYEMFKRETGDGIGRTGIRAGVIKLASSRDSITPYEQMFFKAAARVCREDGVPILTHTQEGQQGPEQAELLLGEGAPAGRVMIGHICGSTNMDYLLRVLEQGVFIGFDRFGVEGLAGAPADSRRIACLLGLMAMGYERQIMIAHDFVNYWLGRAGTGEAVMRVAKNWHPTHIFQDIIPVLKQAGITDGQLRTLLAENTRRFLCGA